MKAYIENITSYLPEDRLDNEELNRLFPEWAVDKISSKTGIDTRPIAGENEFSSDMAAKAITKMLDQGLDPGQVDFLILCTQSPDYVLPTTACVVQKKAGLPTRMGAMDINLGCSGYVYSLGAAKGLIESGQAKNVLVATAETYSKYIHPGDKSVRTIFADAATATLVSSKQAQDEIIGPFEYGTNGKGAENLILKNSGTVSRTMGEDHFPENPKHPFGPDYLYMNGPQIFRFVISQMPEAISRLVEKADLDMKDVDKFVFHQANAYILEVLRKKLGVPKEKYPLFMKEVGNSVSSTIPLTLEHLAGEKEINPGDTLLLAGFGVGYSWGGCVVQWQTQGV